jgi:DNA modification methylase
VKQERYYFDQDAVKVRAKQPIGTPPQTGLRTRRTILDINTKSFKGRHYAAFPPELVRIMLLSGSAEGDRVLDPFVGSGTTGQVCKQYNRRFVGLDLQPTYFEMCKERIDSVTLPILEQIEKAKQGRLF